MLTQIQDISVAQSAAAEVATSAIALAKRPSIYIPLSRLVISDENVRSKESPQAKDVAELAELIYSQSLLSALHVVAQLADGKETAIYEVVAGGRRLRALQLLASQGRIAFDEDIECKVVAHDASTEVSTAENSGREEMHAADMVLAFRKMVDEGLTVEEVAARFGMRIKLVKQRLRLAHVAPKLLDLFRAGKASLDQMQALAMSDDQQHQVAVWDSLDTYNRNPHALRRRLLTEEVQVSDGRVRFVGLQSYKARGGTTRADLFSPGEQVFITDVPLLDLLLAEKLEEAADVLRAEGWRWVEVRDGFDYSAKSAFSVLKPGSRTADKNESKIIRRAEKVLEIASEARQAYEHVEDDEYDWAKERQLDRDVESAEAALKVLEEELVVWEDEHRSVAGAVVTMEDGKLVIHRGLVRSEDRKVTVQTLGAGGVMGRLANDGDARREKPEVPERLMLALTSQRTIALQAALLQDQHVALAVLACSLLTSMRHTNVGNVAQISMRDCRVRMEGLDFSLKDSRAAKQMNEAGEQWDAELPAKDLFAWLLGQPQGKLLGLLTWCTANSLDAIHGHFDTSHRQSDELAAALKLDMADWWKATPETYLANVPKAKLVEAVTEAVSAEAAKPIEALKKDAAIAMAAQLLEPTRWLPKPLRTAATE